MKTQQNYFSLKTKQHYRVITAVRFQNYFLIKTMREIQCFIRIGLSEHYGHGEQAASPSANLKGTLLIQTSGFSKGRHTVHHSFVLCTHAQASPN